MRKLFAIMAAGSLLVSGAATAAPVPTGIILGVSIQGLAPITLAGTTTVSVTGSTVTIGAGAITLPAPLVVPVTGTTAINSLTAKVLSNLAGTFSAGGVTAQGAGELCGAGPGAGQACNVGGGVGGIMGLTGAIAVHVIPNIVVIPVNLNAALLGQGNPTSQPFTFDAALWTTGTGLVNTGNNIVGVTGSLSPLTLVTPTFVLAIGNLLPIFATLTFTNTGGPLPEPGALLLIGTGVVGIALLRRSGRR